eukprot:gb/GECG01006777.1/.p1 GENE.gb/GECG01006777.1/~~gb/GECG01006777.1/.p1  ORF type:complete len:159 (+),score=16.40 gb/GECG01006777.1/:1-477(+)
MSSIDQFGASSTGVDTVEFKYKCKFDASANYVYTALTDPADVMRYTMAKAEGDVQEGGTFSMFEGAIHGKYTELVQGKRIAMYWRFKDWADGTYSIVTIDLEPQDEDTTIVTLHQIGIPRVDKFGNSKVEENVRVGWRERIFKGIKERLGFGFEELDG